MRQDSEAAVNRQINLELYASYVYLSVSYYLDGGDVALKNFAKYFLHQSHEERENAEKLMKLQNRRGGRIFLQDIKKTDRDDWENGLKATEYAPCLERSVNQSLLELHKLATEKNDPHLCDFIETHYLNEQVEAIKEFGDHKTNVCKIWAPGSGMAEYLSDKHTLGHTRAAVAREPGNRPVRPPFPSAGRWGGAGPQAGRHPGGLVSHPPRAAAWRGPEPVSSHVTLLREAPPPLRPLGPPPFPAPPPPLRAVTGRGSARLSDSARGPQAPACGAFASARAG
ncbi:hypothetical protein ABFV05_012986 [Capra hircus]